MTKRHIETLESLCGRAEKLQAELMRYVGKSDKARRVEEAVAKAKNELLRALRTAEGS